MEKQPLISIIVPIYNVEKYLEKCINSLLSQTYKNIEIILVDDGSPDLCPQIVDRYKNTYEMIKVFHKENGGLSDARNFGLKHAKGEYIGFVDSDDYIEPEMYESLIKGMIRNNCLLGECGVKCIYKDKIIANYSNKSYVLNTKDAVKKYYSTKIPNKIPRTAVWSKLFHKSLLINKLFPTGHIHEDYSLIMKCMIEAKRIYYIEKPLYNHIYTNSSSITSAKFRREDLYKQIQFEKIINIIKETKDDELLNLAKIDYYNLCLQFFYRCFYNDFDEYKSYKQILISNKKEIINLNFRKKDKIQFYLFYLNSKLYLLLRSIRKNL